MLTQVLNRAPKPTGRQLWFAAVWMFSLSHLLLSPACSATIAVGDHRLLPNQPNQVIEIVVSGGELVAGVNLFAQVGDGGPELSEFGLPAGLDGPSITAIDLVSDTIFAESGAAQDVQPSVPQVAVASIELTEPNAFTEAEGILARLTVDTTGFDSGSWPLLLSGVLPTLTGGPFNTDFAGQSIEIQNGSLTIHGENLRGDFDANGVIDVRDIERLAVAVRMAGDESRFDLNADATVSFEDFRQMIDEIVITWFGDANLDGRFDTTDLVAVFQAGEYEDDLVGNSTWSRGDWNADGEFDTSDLVLAFTTNGFEQGPRALRASESRAVPEPSDVWPLWIATILLGRNARCRKWR